MPKFIDNRRALDPEHVHPGVIAEVGGSPVGAPNVSPEMPPDWACSMSFYLNQKKATGGGDPNAGKGSM